MKYSSAIMTKGERADLTRLVRQRERLMKTLASQRSAELLADFERQVGAIYSFDDDETWKAAHAAADKAVKDAKAVIAQRCKEMGIPKEFAPTITANWWDRGQNAMKERRTELRKMAVTRIAAQEKSARTEIEKISIQAQTELVAEGLTSDAAQAFLTNMPSVEVLMPALDSNQIKGFLASGPNYGKAGPPEYWE